MHTPTLKALTQQLITHHDPMVRTVVAALETLIAERDAWQFKYEQAVDRIGCLECQIAKAEYECPLYLSKLSQGEFEAPDIASEQK